MSAVRNLQLSTVSTFLTYDAAVYYSFLMCNSYAVECLSHDMSVHLSVTDVLWLSGVR